MHLSALDPDSRTAEQSGWRLSALERNQLLAALLTASLLVLPIALHVPLYQDDFERAVNGMYYWSGDGRPLSEFIARLLALGSPQLALTSPLGTLLCIPGMAFTAILLCRLLEHRRSWGAVLATVLLFGSPYFIENLSFSFDGPLMVLAVFFAVSAADLVVEGRDSGSLIVGIGLTVCSLALYQAANPGLWIPVLWLVLFPPRGRPPSIGRLLQRLVSCELVALLVYRLLVVPSSGMLKYALKHGRTPALLDLPMTVITNLRVFVAHLLDDWVGTAGGTLLCLFLVIGLLISALEVSDSGAAARRPLLFLWRAVAGLLLLLVSYGLTLILLKPVMDPRAFIGVGVVLACLGLSATRQVNAAALLGHGWRALRAWLSLGITASVAWLCVAVLFAYTSAYAQQQQFNDEILAAIAMDVHERIDQPIRDLAIEGRAPLAPAAANTLRSFPVLKHYGQVAPLHVFWPNLRFMTYGFQALGRDGADSLTSPRSVVSTSLYDLAVDQSTLLIRFRSK